MTIRNSLRALSLAWGCTLACADAQTAAPAAGNALGPVATALAAAREDEKVADDVQRALAERWPELSELLRGAPLESVEDVMRARGEPDREAGLPVGAFGSPAARRRYFAAVLVGWSSAQNALAVAARVESQRLAGLSTARGELPDVDQRQLLDRLARASSDRLHGLCQRVSAVHSACSDVLPTPGPNS